jgi:hypothetical protein
MTEDGYVQGDGWVPGVDFDPTDPEEMEVMKVVWEREKFDRIHALEEENARLRALVNEHDDERRTRIVDA